MTFSSRAKGFLSVATITATATVLALASGTGGCSDSRPEASSGASGGTTSTSSGSSGSSGVTNDGGADAFADGGESCATIPLLGAMIDEVEQRGDPPAPLGATGGGTLSPGTYDLIELLSYVAPPDGGVEEDPDGGTGPGPSQRLTGRSTQATIVVAGDTLRKTSTVVDSPDGGAARTTTTASTFVAGGTSLATTAICPTAGDKAVLSFSAIGATSIVLYPDQKRREVYARRP